MKKTILFGALMLCAIFTSARADIIPTYVSNTPSGGNTIWSYNVNVTVDQNATSGDYFTIYDFGDFIAGSNVQPDGWTFSFALVGVTPGDTTPPDSPSLYNLTWTYTGAAIIGGSAAGTNIGPFSIAVAGLSDATANGYFTAQGTRSGDPEGTKISNVGRITIPVAVPEPSTIALIAGTAGLGMVGRALARRRKL